MTKTACVPGKVHLFGPFGAGIEKCYECGLTRQTSPIEDGCYSAGAGWQEGLKHAFDSNGRCQACGVRAEDEVAAMERSVYQHMTALETENERLKRELKQARRPYFTFNGERSAAISWEVMRWAAIVYCILLLALGLWAKFR